MSQQKKLVSRKRRGGWCGEQMQGEAETQVKGESMRSTRKP